MGVSESSNGDLNGAAEIWTNSDVIKVEFQKDEPVTVMRNGLTWDKAKFRWAG